MKHYTPMSMFDEIKKLPNGHFFYQVGMNLNNLCTENKVPKDGIGVYIFYKQSEEKVELVYIGKAGTVEQAGAFKKQGLRGRIPNKVNGIKRQEFFEQKFKESPYDALHIYWYETSKKKDGFLPAYIEATLLQEYYLLHGKLPPWNKEF